MNSAAEGEHVPVQQDSEALRRDTPPASSAATVQHTTATEEQQPEETTDGRSELEEVDWGAQAPEREHLKGKTMGPPGQTLTLAHEGPEHPAEAHADKLVEEQKLLAWEHKDRELLAEAPNADRYTSGPTGSGKRDKEHRNICEPADSDADKTEPTLGLQAVRVKVSVREDPR